jgi:hypothetical protein
VQQARRSKCGAASAASAAQQARRSKRGAGALAGEAAKFELVCGGQRCSVGTGACVPWRRGQRGDAPAAGGVGGGAGGSPGDARARGAQAWAVLDTLGCGQGCVQAQSAQGMGAQKRGAALPLGSGKARGVGVRRRGAARGVAAQHRGSSGSRVVECTRAKEWESACGRRGVDCRDHQCHEMLIAHTSLEHETTRPLLLKQDQALTTIGS